MDRIESPNNAQQSLGNLSFRPRRGKREEREEKEENGGKGGRGEKKEENEEKEEKGEKEKKKGKGKGGTRREGWSPPRPTRLEVETDVLERFSHATNRRFSLRFRSTTGGRLKTLESICWNEISMLESPQ